MLKLKKLFFIIQYFFYKNPIKRAILKNNVIILRYLLKRQNNSDLNQLDKHYKTLLDYALLNNNIEIIKLLISYKAKLGKILYDAQTEEELIKFFIILYKADYDFNNIDKLGYTAAHYALSLKSKHAINLLYVFGTKLSSPNFNLYNNKKLITKIEDSQIFIGSA